MFDGLEQAVCATLEVTALRHRSALQQLGGRPAVPPGAVAAISDIVAGNWASARAAGIISRSRQNWRWFCPQTQIGSNNTSPEVRLERAIVGAAVRAGREDWSNQVPVASGVVGPAGERRRAIDLVHRVDQRSFEFIELKIASDTPLYAAVEIIAYTCVWLQARQDDRVATTPLLEAATVTAVVLAPDAYYRPYQLTLLQRQLDQELRLLGKAQGVTLGFKFEALPAELALAAIPDEDALLAGLTKRQGL